MGAAPSGRPRALPILALSNQLFIPKFESRYFIRFGKGNMALRPGQSQGQVALRAHCLCVVSLSVDTNQSSLRGFCAGLCKSL